METIKEAKEYLRANFEKGCKCPVCDGHVKMYKRKLNSGMALFLIGLYKLTIRDRKLVSSGLNYKKFTYYQFYQNKEVYEIMGLKVTSLDYAVMRHFGLIEARVSEGGKRDSGYWRLTPTGETFVFSHTTMDNTCPKYVFLYNNKRIGVSDEETTIKQALGDKFDYQELMNNK